MKKFTVPCVFGEEKRPFDIYIGDPAPGRHPVGFQAAWLTRVRSGQVPDDVMDSFANLLALARKHNVSFADLCVRAMRQVHAVGTTPEPPIRN